MEGMYRKAGAAAAAAATEPEPIATENQVCTSATVPQRIDRSGSKVEEIAGTGEHDAHGG
jgi:hypothetical protein